MKKVMLLVLSGWMGIAVASFGQDRQTDAVVRANQPDRMDRARLDRVQHDRIKQVRLDRSDRMQQRIEQARIKQARHQDARIKDARLKDKRIKDARLKDKRIKDARLKDKRIKDAREDAANDGSRLDRRRYHKAKMKRARLANQVGDENSGN